MTENKTPSYPWYPRDFAGDEPVQLMTLEEEGAYRRLLDHQSLHGTIPSDPVQLAKICKNLSVPRMRKLWESIAPCFVAAGEEGRLYNRKLQRVLDEREQYRRQQSESGRRGAEARWGRDRPTDGDPNGDPNGEPMPSPEAKPWPAMATASASAVSPPVGPAEDPPAPGGSDVARLLTGMGRTVDRWAVFDFLERVPTADLSAWTHRLAGYLQGLDFPAGVRPTAEQLATACRDFTGDFKSPAHFRGFVLRAIQGPRSRPAGPRDADKTGATLAAVDRFVKGGA